jgi:hypothetical protein
MSTDFEVLEVVEALSRFPGISELLTYDSTPKTKLFAPDVAWFISFELERTSIGRESIGWIMRTVEPNKRDRGLRVEMLVKLLDEETALITLQGFPNSRVTELAEALSGASHGMCEHTRWN